MTRRFTLALFCALLALPMSALAADTPSLQAKKRSLGGSLVPEKAPMKLASEARVASQTVTTIENGDGTYEGVWGLVPENGIDPSEWVQRFTFPASSGTITDAAVCFSSDFGGDFDFELIIFQANGNQPGAELARIAYRTPRLEALVIECLTLPDVNFVTSSNRLFLGVQFSANDDILVLADENSAEAEPSYVRAPGVIDDWQRLGDATPLDAVFRDFKNLALAVSFDDGDGNGGGPTGSTDPCVENTTTLCLNDDRFEVQVTFSTEQGDSGDGNGVELTNDSGYFWFFDSDNVELVVKVLDACVINSNYWVFGGGLTDVQVTITIRDTFTGFVRTYVNPLGTPFQPITDINGFATCP